MTKDDRTTLESLVKVWRDEAFLHAQAAEREATDDNEVAEATMHEQEGRTLIRCADALFRILEKTKRYAARPARSWRLGWRIGLAGEFTSASPRRFTGEITSGRHGGPVRDAPGAALTAIGLSGGEWIRW
jgi:hypothetical protein